MPGMMDTVLNVGLTEGVRDALAVDADNESFAADTWLRFCRQYAEIVLELPKAEIDEAAASDTSSGGLREAAERVCALAENAGGIPTDAFTQLRETVAAVCLPLLDVAASERVPRPRGHL